MANKTKYIVELNDSEREILQSIVKTGKVAAAKRQRAQIYLYADRTREEGELSDSKIADKLNIAKITVQRARQRLVEKGFEAALERAPRTKNSIAKKLSPEQEAKLVALACTKAPEGHARWSLRLLSEHMVILDYVDSISHELVRQVLKKSNQALATQGMVYSAKAAC